MSRQSRTQLWLGLALAAVLLGIAAGPSLADLIGEDGTRRAVGVLSVLSVVALGVVIFRGRRRDRKRK